VKVNWPFRYDQSVWDLCTGLVSQVIFNMPVIRDTSAPFVEYWSLPDVVRQILPEYDPVMNSDFDKVPITADHTSMLEKYVSQLLADSFEQSSLYWHYAMRYVPSDSLACLGDYSSQRAPAGTKVVVGNTFINNDALKNSLSTQYLNICFCIYVTPVSN
jgi:hypothetical protein